MIRTKAYMLKEISQLKKRKKQVEIELLTLSKVGAIKDVFKLADDLLRKEIFILTGKIEAHQWTAYTNEKSLPKIKSKNNKKKEEKK